MTAIPVDAGALQLELLVQGAAAAAATLPTAAPVTAAAAQPGDDQVVAVFPRALAADVVGRPARVALLVGDELARVLASQGGADLAATFQPALDALGATFGVQVGAAQEVTPADVPAALGPWSVVPLIGEGFAGGIAVSDSLLAAGTEPVPEGAVAAPTAPSATATRTPGTSSGVASPHGTSRPPVVHRGIDMLHDVDLEISVELGRTRLLVRDLLTLAPGDVVELDRAAGSPADLLVSGRLIARGEVVVVDEDFGLRITQIIEPSAG